MYLEELLPESEKGQRLGQCSGDEDSICVMMQKLET